MVRFLAILTGALACASVVHAGPSSFQRSCSDIRTEFANDEVTISATCRDKAGRNQPADFPLSGYHNIDGRLVFDGKGKGSFHRSCQNDKLNVSPERVLFSSDCKARNQSVRRTTIEIQDVQNIDGKLVRIVGSAPPPGPASARPPAGSTEEPFGMGFDGWKFTQENTKEGILCRAILGTKVIARYTNAKMYVSMPAGKVVAGTYPETFFQIGKESEPVTAKSNGKRFWLESDEGFLNKLASAGGYSWRTGPVKGQFLEGRVTFNASTDRALKELHNCAKANGGR